MFQVGISSTNEIGLHSSERGVQSGHLYKAAHLAFHLWKFSGKSSRDNSAVLVNETSTGQLD